jgi:hypothetical protein
MLFPSHSLYPTNDLTRDIFFFVLGRPLAAVQHLLSMKYLVTLIGGPRHPQLVNVYLRLMGVYVDLGDYTTAQSLLAEAKTLCTDVAKQCMITATVAEIFDKMVDPHNVIPLLLYYLLSLRYKLHLTHHHYHHPQSSTLRASFRRP